MASHPSTGIIVQLPTPPKQYLLCQVLAEVDHCNWEDLLGRQQYSNAPGAGMHGALSQRMRYCSDARKTLVMHAMNGAFKH